MTDLRKELERLRSGYIRLAQERRQNRNKCDMGSEEWNYENISESCYQNMADDLGEILHRTAAAELTQMAEEDGEL